MLKGKDPKNVPKNETKCIHFLLFLYPSFKDI